MAKKNASKKAPAENLKVRRTTLFPACSFEEALTIANAIQKHASGQKVRRLTLFDQIGKSPDSGPSRQLIINSNKYGLTKGSYASEYLELSADGKLATAPDAASRDKLKARFKLAIESIAPFSQLYQAEKGNRLPANSVLEDLATEYGVPAQDSKECVEVFIVNAKFLGILKPIAGAERVIPIEQALEEMPIGQAEQSAKANTDETTDRKNVSSQSDDEQDWEHTCFYISPIGEDGSEHRDRKSVV